MSPSELAKRLASSVDPSSGDPVAHQLVEQIWLEVVEGSIETGARMPTVRGLAIQLGVTPRSVKWAYDELERLGVVATRPGEGTFVKLTPASDEERRRRQAFLDLCGDSVQKARALGYDVDDLMGALAEFREIEREGAQKRDSR